MPTDSTDATAPGPVPVHKPGPTHYAVLDYEGSGLVVPTGILGTTGEPHAPGVDPDCLLEVALVVLDAGTLEEVHRDEWLILPPGVKNEAFFHVWETALREKNPFVFEMHSKDTPESPKHPLGRPSLLKSLRAVAADIQPEAYYVTEIEAKIVQALSGFLPPGYATGAPIHPGNSPLMFTGNSIANYDIPMMRAWMPRLHNMLSYRIMDVSVLRTYYMDTCGIPLPPGLAESIKAGASEHRAIADAELCAENLRALRSYTNESFVALANASADAVEAELRRRAAAKS